MKYCKLILVLIISVLSIQAETIINDDIKSNTQWLKSNSPYIINKNITVESSATLNIEEGCTIYLRSEVFIIVKGILNVSGSPSSKVIFTGYNNENWDYIYIKNKSVLSNIELSKGGKNSSVPIIINGSNDIIINNLTLINNKSDEIGFKPDGSAYMELNDYGYNYYISDNIVINEYNNLIVNENVKIRLNSNILLRIRGNINFNGRADECINIFGLNKWGGIYLDNTANASFKWVKFENGGSSILTQNSMIIIDGANVFFDACSFTNSQSKAITILKAANHRITNIGYNQFNNFKKPYYAINNLSADDIQFTNNCFGTNDSVKINELIYDGKDRSGKGLVEFIPFLINCEMNAPNKIKYVSPLTNSIDLPVNLNIRWNNDLMANHYNFELFSNPNLSDTVYSVKLNDTIVSIFNLEYGATYYWKVVGENSKGFSTDFDVFNFTTYDTSKPKSPEIISHNNNDSIFCNTNIKWENIKNADFYNINIANDFNFNTIVINDTTNKYDTSFTFSSKPNDIIFIRIRAHNRNGWSEWSDIVKLLNYDYYYLNKILNVKGEIIQYKSFISNNIIGSILYKKDEVYYIDEINTNYELRNIYISDNKITDFEVLGILENNTIEYVILHSDKLILNKEKENIVFQIALNQMKLSDFNNNGSDDLISIDSSNHLVIFYDIRTKGIDDFSQLYSNVKSYDIIDIDRNSNKDILLIDSIKSVISLTNNFDNFTSKTMFEKTENNSIKVRINQDFSKVYLFGSKLEIIELSNNNELLNIDNFEFDIQNIFFGNINNNNETDEIFISSNSIQIYNLTNREIIFKDGENFNNLFYNQLINDDIIAWKDSSLFFYKYNKCSINNPPNEPTDLRYTFSNDDILLEWSIPADDVTHEKEIRYFLEIINDNTNEYILNFPISNEYRYNKEYITTNYILLKGINEGKYRWSVMAIDNSGHYSRSEESLFRTNDYLSGPPQSWFFEKKTGSNSLLILRNSSQPKFNNRNMISGDAVGVFYFRDTALVCGGYGIWDENRNMAITAWGDNYQTENIKDGFEFGEDYRFKFWDSFSENESDIAFNIENGTNYFKPDTVTILGSIVQPDSQLIYLYPNTWNLISSRVIPFESTIDKLFSGSIVKDIDGNSIDFWKSNSGFQVYSNVPDTILFIGQTLDLKNFKINIEANKWHLLPNPYYYDVDINQVFSENQNLVLINDNQELNWLKESYLEFATIEKGRSLYLYSFDDFDLGFKLNDTIQTKTNHYIYNNTSEYLIVKVNFDAISAGTIKFLNSHGEIIKKIDYNSNKLIALLPGKHSDFNCDNCYSADEEIVIEIESNGEKVPYIISKINNLKTDKIQNDLIFNDKAIYELDISINETKVVMENKIINVYPNPSKTNIFIDNFKNNSFTAYYLYDNLGNIVAEGLLTPGICEIDLAGIISGKYILKLKNSKKSADINIIIIK